MNRKGPRDWTCILVNGAWDKPGRARFLRDKDGNEDIERPPYILLRNKARQKRPMALTTSLGTASRPDDGHQAISISPDDYECLSESGDADTTCEYRAVRLPGRIWFAKGGRLRLGLALLGFLAGVAGALGEFTTELADRHLPLWPLIVIGALILIGMVADLVRTIVPSGN